MAFVTDVNCNRCGLTKYEVTNRDNLCNDCRKEEADKKRRVYLASLNGLTLEERIERIEAFLYDNPIPKEPQRY